MAQFHYRARNGRGEALEGVLEGSSADAVAGQLINTGITPIEIIEQQPESQVLANLRRQLTSRRPSIDELALFSRQMHTLMRAGVPIIRALHGLAESTRNPLFAETLRDVIAQLESGRDLTAALGAHPRLFGTLMVSIVQVGESTGRLDEAFEQLAVYLEQERDIRERIKTALRYPALVLTAIAVAITIINIWVIPAFARVFQRFHAELPWPTQVLIRTSDFMVQYWPMLLLGLIAGASAIVLHLRTEQGRYRWDKIKLKLPAVGGIVRRATLARFARAFALAQRSGVPLIQTLTVVARAVDNAVVGDRILLMRNGIERGDSLTRTAATTGMFTPLVLQMLSVGEETGAVDELMQQVAEYYEREVDHDLKTLSAAIEPLLIVAIGVMVLILALGVFLPMWDLARVVH